MRIDVRGKLPKDKDIDGVPTKFFMATEADEFEQIDFSKPTTPRTAKPSSAGKPLSDFENQYRQFYADLYAFHKRYYGASALKDFNEISVAIGKLGEDYPTEFCRTLIVKVFEELEREYISAGDTDHEKTQAEK